jgi:hypothetical protein
MTEELLKGVRQKLNEGALGTEKFVRQVRERFGIGSLRPRGRSRKGEK